MKVFIADDSVLVRERLRDVINEIPESEVVGEAEDGAEAIESISRIEPDIVILDIRMPGGNGVTVLERIKKMQPSPIVIMLTNYPYPQYRGKCMDLGADYFFDKSNEFEKVMEVLVQLIQDSRT